MQSWELIVTKSPPHVKSSDALQLNKGLQVHHVTKFIIKSLIILRIKLDK